MHKPIIIGTGLKVRNNGTGEEEILETDGIFVAIGHKPNTAFLGGQVDTDELGYIQVKPGTTETNIPGVFACGDVQDSKYRQAIYGCRKRLYGGPRLREVFGRPASSGLESFSVVGQVLLEMNGSMERGGG
jgi:NADPH-dependent glutamate synthase beta subunit-like oxidoreductase